MSWDQGIQMREDLPADFIKLVEKVYEIKYNEKAELKYITWFGAGDVITADFGTQNALDIQWAKFVEEAREKGLIK